MPTVDSEPGTPLTSRDGALENAAPEPDGCHEAIETSGSQNVSRVRARTAFARLAFRLESSLTNEVQWRAKRVRCNAGLGVAPHGRRDLARWALPEARRGWEFPRDVRTLEFGRRAVLWKWLRRAAGAGGHEGVPWPVSLL